MKLPELGEVFEGRYVLVKVLGRGGFAAVYLAEDQEVERNVAIKILAPGEDGYGGALAARFMREARVLAGLRDPHTITMFDFGTSATGLLFMVTQYIEARDLKEVLAQEGALPQDVVVHVLLQICSALTEAHAAGILHRDLKLGNILIHEYAGDPYQAKLIDFGIAKAVADSPEGESLTRTGAFVGTPRYMAPEALCGEELTTSSDIYSLGLVVYELLVGEPAVNAKDTRMMLVQALSEEPLLLPPTVPVAPWFRHIVERMLARRPENRFPSAEEVAVAIEAGLDGLDSLPPGPGPVHHPPPLPPGATGGFLPAGQAAATLPESPYVGAPPLPPSATKKPSPWIAFAGIAVLLAVLVGAVVSLTSATKRGVYSAPAAPPAAVTAPIIEEPLPPTETLQPAADPPDLGGTASAADLGSDDPRPDTGPAIENSPISGCGQPPPFEGEQLLATSVEGVQRQWHVRLPDGYDPNVPHRTMILFHNAPFNGAHALEDYGMQGIADEQGLVLLAPTSATTFKAWSNAEDYEFVERAYEETFKILCLDPQWIYGVGVGSGGRAVERIGCHMKMSGVVGSGYREKRSFKMCEFEAPLPTMHIRGREDRNTPSLGGANCQGNNVFSDKEHRDRWLKAFGCSTDAGSTPFDVGPKGTCQQWACDTPFVTCSVEGGHFWPGMKDDIAIPTCYSDRSKFPYQATVWRFLEQHGRPIE